MTLRHYVTAYSSINNLLIFLCLGAKYAEKITTRKDDKYLKRKATGNGDSANLSEKRRKTITLDGNNNSKIK